MLSLETAKRLKDAGLKWEPQYGDIMTSMYDGFKDNSYVLDEYLVIDKEFIEDYPALKPDELKEFRKWAIFLPRLDQLLDEIEGRGYVWKLRSRADGKYFVALFGKNDENYLVQRYWAEADSPEEAAAAALIWILEQEA